MASDFQIQIRAKITRSWVGHSVMTSTFADLRVNAHWVTAPAAACRPVVSVSALILGDMQCWGWGLWVRQGEGCHMIGLPSGELLKKPSQQSGQGHKLVLTPKEKTEVCAWLCAQRQTSRSVTTRSADMTYWWFQNTTVYELHCPHCLMDTYIQSYYTIITLAHLLQIPWLDIYWRNPG